MINIFSKPSANSITPQMVAEWQKRYGDKLYKLDIDGKVAYCRSPTDKEMVKILKKVCGGDIAKSFTEVDEIKTMKRAFEIGFLGGDKGIINNVGVINLIKNTWPVL